MAGKLGIPWPICGGIPAEHLGPHDASVNGFPKREPMRHAGSGGARGRRAGELRRAPVPRLSAAAAGRT